MSIETCAAPYQGPSDLNKVYSVASRPGGLSYRGNGLVRNLTKPFGQQRVMKHPHLIFYDKVYAEVKRLFEGVSYFDAFGRRALPVLMFP